MSSDIDHLMSNDVRFIKSYERSKSSSMVNYKYTDR